MQIKVNNFNQEEYEKSVSRVASKLNTEDRRMVRNILIAVKDSIDDAVELQKRLDSIDLTEAPKRVAQPKPVEEKNKVKEDEEVEETEYEIDAE